VAADGALLAVRLAAPGLTRESAAAALARSLVPAPAVYGVSWFDGSTGGRSTVGEHDGPTFTDELAARLAIAKPKGQRGADALLPGVTDPDRTDAQRTAIRSVTFVHVDHDKGTTTLGEARAILAAVGLGAWMYPSPSAPLGPAADATRWRCLIPLAAATSAVGYDLAAGLVRDIAVAIFGQGVDRSTYRPEALAYVHPRLEVGPRGADALVVVAGAALDVGQLAEVATQAGWWHPRPARDALRAGVRDGAALFAVWRAAGYVVGTANAKGWASGLCPRECWHSAHSPTRRDTSTAIHEHIGAFVCAHDHSLGPADERGPANTAKGLRWLIEDRPELSADVALARDAGQLGEVVAALASTPYGEASRRVVHLAAVADDTAEALARAARVGKLVLYTPSVGSGKSRATGAAVAALVRDVALQPDDDAAQPMASAAVTVRDRASMPAAAASLLAAGVPVRVHTPVHEVVDAVGEPVCEHHVIAKGVYLHGGSARASVCPAVPSPSGVAPCPHMATCPARSPWVPWDIGPDGKPRAESWRGAPAGEAWVAVTTHATPAPMRRGAPLVVDEADVALRPKVTSLDADGLLAALAWAEILAPVRIHGESEPTAAPRYIARAIARSAFATGLESLPAVLPAERLAWCIVAVMSDAAASSPAAVRDLARWAPGVSAEDVHEAIVRAAVGHWISKGANAHAISLGHRRALPQSGAEPLRTLARWAGGCHARYVADDGAEPVMQVAGPSTAALAAVTALARGGGVLALDATGDPAIARAAVGAEQVEHDPVRVDDGAEVTRLLVHTSRAGRRALAPRAGVVDWHEHREPALLGALGALRSAWRGGSGIGDGLVIAPRALALACSVLAAAGVEADAEAVAAEVDRQCDAAKVVSDALRAGVRAWCLAADDATRRLVDGFGAHGDVRWTHYGSAEAHGAGLR